MLRAKRYFIVGLICRVKKVPISDVTVEALSALCEVSWGKGMRQQFTEAGFFVRSIWLGQVYNPV